MTTSMNHAALILQLNERLFTSALSGITEEQAKERISHHNNPVIWIAAHTLWARYQMLNFLGKGIPNPYDELFVNFKPYNASDSYPTLQQVKTAWHQVSELLKAALQSVTDDTIARDGGHKTPIGDTTNGGTLAFLTQHESYDIGQLAFLKKYLTKEAMQYN